MTVEPSAVGDRELVWAERDLVSCDCLDDLLKLILSCQSVLPLGTGVVQDLKLNKHTNPNSTACFDFAYLTTLLHHGLGFPMTEPAFLFKDASGNTVG